MARVKYYDSTAQTWKYADMALQTGIHVGTTAPTNEAMLWVDTASNQIDSFPLTDVQDSSGTSLISNGVAIIPVTDVEDSNGNSLVTSGVAQIPAIPSIAGLEATANKVTLLSSSSTDTEYPSAKCVYDELQNIPSMPSGTNNGDILEWNGSAWVSKPKWRMIYQPVEYIESTGAQYIKTGVIVSNSISAVIDELLLQTSNFAVTGVGRYTSNNNVIFLYGVVPETAQGKISTMYLSKTSSVTSADWCPSTADINSRHTIELANGSQKVDGVEIGTQTIASGKDTSTYDITIFARNSDGSYNPKISERIYSYKIYDGQTLIRDYIPVYNVYTGEAGLYDKANNIFYGNNGSGTFTKGADV